MTLITDTLIFRETLSVPSIVPVNGAEQYSNKYLVIEVTGGESETTPYPGITLEQIFVNNAAGLVGASLPLRIGKQLVEVMPFGLYKIRLIAGGGIVRATVKIWENTGVLYNYATETPTTPENNAGNITGEEIKNRLVDLISPNRLPLSAIEGAENLGENLEVTWENLTGKPTTFPPISHNHIWSQITDKPSFATVATSGDYNDLINKPTGGSGGGREVLAADRTYFVRTDGSDNNNGLTNTAGGAFATIQKAIDVAFSCDWSIFEVKIKITGNFTISSPINIPILPVGGKQLVIEGDPTTPINSTLTSSVAIKGYFWNKCQSRVIINGIAFRQSGDVIGNEFIRVEAGGKLLYLNCDFGAGSTNRISGNYHIRVNNMGQALIHGSYKITGGNCYAHVFCDGGFWGSSQEYLYGTVTVNVENNPVFGVFLFCYSGGNSGWYFGWVAFSGSAIGSKYSAENGRIYYQDGGASYLPGNSGGGVSAGGSYNG